MWEREKKKQNANHKPKAHSMRVGSLSHSAQCRSQVKYMFLSWCVFSRSRHFNFALCFIVPPFIFVLFCASPFNFCPERLFAVCIIYSITFLNDLCICCIFCFNVVGSQLLEMWQMKKTWFRVCARWIFVFLMIWISLVQKEIDKLTVTFGVFVCIWLVAIESEINNILDPKYTINNHHDNSNNEFYFACDGSVRTAHVPWATYRWRFEGGIWPMAMADIIAPVAHIHLSA